MSSLFPSGETVFTRRTPRRFIWKEATATLAHALSGRQPGTTAGAIIDAGPFPQGINEEHVDAAQDALNKIADAAGEHRPSCRVTHLVGICPFSIYRYPTPPTDELTVHCLYIHF